MLRDVLASLPGLGTWPCDEINYIWRHGNARFPNDEFKPEMATPKVQRYVRRAFQSVQRKGSLRRVVEKTCANSLRVGFLQTIFPEAQLIHILRDGRDVVASAALRWKASVDIPYLAKKARFVPLLDLPYYAARYFFNRARKTLSPQNRLASWGPRISGMEELIRNCPLEIVCAMQWKRCVESANSGFRDLEDGHGMTIKYEEFVLDPRGELRRILEFLGIQEKTSVVEKAIGNVSSNSLGRWKDRLDAGIQPLIEEEIADCLLANGYPVGHGVGSDGR